jgi:hypothetical protein
VLPGERRRCERPNCRVRVEEPDPGEPPLALDHDVRLVPVVILVRSRLTDLHVVDGPAAVLAPLRAGPLGVGASRVGEELAVDDVAEVTLEGPEGLSGGFALGDAAVEVGASPRVGLA